MLGCSSATHSSLTCFQRVLESKCSDVALVAGCVAFLIIGLLATVGVLNGMGAVNAAYLSYGMYAGATVFLILEIVKIILSCVLKAKPPKQELPLQFPIPNYRGPDAGNFINNKKAEDIREAAKEWSEVNFPVEGAKTDEEKKASSARLYDFLCLIIDNPEFRKDKAFFIEAWKAHLNLKNDEDRKKIPDSYKSALAFFETWIS